MDQIRFGGRGSFKGRRRVMSVVEKGDEMDFKKGIQAPRRGFFKGDKSTFGDGRKNGGGKLKINSGREMAWCSHCGKNCNTSRDYTTNNTSCIDCGKVLFEDIYTEEATFVNDAAGEAHLTGNATTKKLIYKNGITKVSHATRHYKEPIVKSSSPGTRKSFPRDGQCCWILLLCQQDTSHGIVEGSESCDDGQQGRETIWCPHCVRNGGTAHDHTTGSVNCVDCGKVLFEEIYTEKATIFRDAAGRSNRNVNAGRIGLEMMICGRKLGLHSSYPDEKDERKQVLDAKRLKPVQTASEAAGQLSMKKPNPMNCTYAIGKAPVNEDDETEDVNEEDDYSETGGHEWRSYDNEQESCSYDYNYDYDAGDENDDY
ncbi:hypothetical protein L6452_19811 [Arctium lappa]|uniref:Uncharacterized protein n=1 Tax=Arctium lappa TaxID=4217 RepID=A0ACB9B9L3_ARCLA|nr:hypothetical protein L6452_19811 [Arctium lappa]